ncbi:MAG TPA: hypothetical protein VH302_01365 [Bryobacteraceae bacterium]|jgi:hypothetical protein|nr:hypothetical protein [Bryobacteraceae bacterium]
MRTALFLLLVVTVFVSRADVPLPNRQQLKDRTLASLKKSEKELEKYSCMVETQEDKLNSDGSVKEHKTREQERFFVNGVEVDHLLKRDGKPLSAGDAKKEQDRVNYEAKKYSNLKNVEKRQQEDEKQIDMFLRALKFTNERRERRDGRSTIVFDLKGDPDFHAKNLDEKFAVAMVGRIWIDEETGNIDEVRAHTDKDIKIGGGLVASIHKGFHVALVQERMPDGVWLAKMVEGSGDARAALFLHPRFRFHEDLTGCHLFSVGTQQSIKSPETQNPGAKP